MTSKERLLTALDGGMPDRLPVTTHHVMPYFTEKYLEGVSADGFFDHFGMDGIRWVVPVTADAERGEFVDPSQDEAEFFQVLKIESDNWRLEETTRLPPSRPSWIPTTIRHGCTSSSR